MESQLNSTNIYHFILVLDLHQYLQDGQSIKVVFLLKDLNHNILKDWLQQIIQLLEPIVDFLVILSDSSDRKLKIQQNCLEEQTVDWLLLMHLLMMRNYRRRSYMALLQPYFKVSEPKQNTQLKLMIQLRSSQFILYIGIILTEFLRLMLEHFLNLDLNNQVINNYSY
ncbi:unnamed protein product [Paramecium pentaurelia]|uniref:Uncharacterized protein n=1 Tax=Paramecium pentaurelia TaxID=43138 RepID=A0A8S1WAJ2_9CILI|nr:unnamed protein product [Paramecium pentaurelia]